jgi:PIN domain nuclease of toxin-antitoxin system
VNDIPHFVTDTHALIWHLAGSSRLSGKRAAIFGDADDGKAWIHVSVISLVEIVYLIDRRRIDSAIYGQVLHLLSTPNGSYQPVAIDTTIVEAMATIPRDSVPDMPHRIIAATALSLGYPLITADERIHASGVVDVIWQGEEPSKSPVPPMPNG